MPGRDGRQASAATVADAIAATLAAYGVRRMFGVPGGGSSLELIDACARRDIAYVLTHTECAAALMAAVTGELTGTPGVVSVGLGPGAASVVNGIAYAALDRAPVLLITDSYRPGDHDFISHQRIDQQAVLAPLVKASARATPGQAAGAVAALLDRALAPPVGPVLLELSAIDAALTATDAVAPARPTPPEPDITGDLAAARALIAGARRPALVAGIQTRARDADSVARLADALACPVLTTYKAKGVYPDGGARHAGLFTGARTEAQWLAECDLLILYGVDPIELVASPWPYTMPVVELAEVEIRPHYTTPAASLFGPPARLAEAVLASARPANWPVSPGPQALPEPALDGLSPHVVARALAGAAPAGTRLAVDAGAHMLPAMAHWPARQPFDVLISNGLSTMGLSLPAAIASALAEPQRPVVVMTGDGGLAMCLAELATCARERLPVCVVVFNDGALKLIDVKQEQRGFASRGVRYPPLDFACIAEGCGVRAMRVEAAADLDRALAGAFDGGGPSLIDARIDAGGYRAIFEAIRGAPGAASNT